MTAEGLMADARSAQSPEVGHGYRWLTAAASLVVGAAFLGLWFWLLPRWLGFSVEMAGAARWRGVGAGPSPVGFPVPPPPFSDLRWPGPAPPPPPPPPPRYFPAT